MKADKLVGFFYQWDLGPSHDSAQLIDADNQILAMFPRGLSDSKIFTPNSHSKETSPRKHSIQLLDFTLVFPYLTSTPDVHLNVNSFRINWEEGPIKGLKPSKKLRKNQTVKVLLDKTLQKAKNKRLVSMPNGASTVPARPLNQHPPQSQSRAHHDTQSQRIFSQISSHAHDARDHTSGADRRLLHGANELLQHLDPSSRPNSRNSIGASIQRQEQTINLTTTRGPLQVLPDGEPAANVVRRSGSPFEEHSGREDSISSQPQTDNMNHRDNSDMNGPQSAMLSSPRRTRQETASPLSDPDERADAQLSSNTASRSPSRKRHRESAELDTELTRGGSLSLPPPQRVNPGSPSRKRQRINDTIQVKSGQAVTPERPATKISHLNLKQGTEPNVKPVIDPLPVMKNPWQGLSEIRASDVNIPKDQLELLGRKLCWIPPATGDPEPHGHVPAWLLKQWNSIARLRHELKHKDVSNKAAENEPASPASSQGSTQSSERESSEDEELYPWEGSSPVRGPQNLPPESSPVRQPVSTRRNATPKASSQKERLGDSPRKTQSRVNSKSPTKAAGHPQSTPRTLASKPPLSNEPEKSKAGSPMALTQDTTEVQEPSADREVQGSLARSTSQNYHLGHVGPLGQLISEGEGSTDSDTPSSTVEQPENEDPSNDASDEESVMENSVPLALGESLPPTQSSQVEQGHISSAQPLSQLTEDHVQVAVTPLVVNNRPLEKRDSNQSTGRADSSHPHFSSQSNKPFSQSRVPNTYPYPGSHEKSQASDDPTTSSSLRSEVNASRAEIAVPQTQSSSTNSQSQGTYDPSTHEVVLESSGPNQRYHDVPCLGSNPPAETSNLPFGSSADMAFSQLHDPTQEPMTQLSINEQISSPHPSLMRHLNSSVSSPYQSPSKSPQDTTEEIQQMSPTTPATQSAELVARRSGFIGDLKKSVEAQEIYRKFCNDYPGYTGDYNHFTELCSRLKDVRAQGLLRRSNLWDDFIIMHLERFPSHLDIGTSQAYAEPQSYETYFTSNFSKSANRKRSLSGYAIEVVASQFAVPVMTHTQSSSQMDPPSQTTRREAMNTSLASSFVDRFSTFQAHSFEEPVKNGLPVFQSGLPALDSHITSSMDTGSSSVLVKLEGSEMDQDEVLCTQIAPMSSLIEIPGLAGSQPCAGECQPAVSQIINTQDEQDDVSMAGVEESELDELDNEDISPEDLDAEELDADDTRHETASVELGDDTFISAVSQSNAVEVPETQPEREDEPEEENWFASLRHIWFRDKPVWSDHPTTPFKTWAEADQNVLSERRRRGGAKILLDENGVIRRPTHR